MNHAVIHVSDEVHARVKRFCKERGLCMRDWAALTLVAAMEAEAIPANMSLVKKRVLEEYRTQSSTAWTDPPFYAGRKKKP